MMKKINILKLTIIISMPIIILLFYFLNISNEFMNLSVSLYTYGILSILCIVGFMANDKISIIFPFIVWTLVLFVHYTVVFDFFHLNSNNGFNLIANFLELNTIIFKDVWYLKLEPWLFIIINFIAGVIIKLSNRNKPENTGDGSMS